MAMQTAPTVMSMPKKDESWVARFLELDQNSFFCRISDSYLSDNFELFELDRMVKNYKFALNLLRNRRKEEYESLTTEQKQVIDNNAEVLYGLIHARFIITRKGLEKMKKKYMCTAFGVCQRSNCNEQSLLPTAITDQKGKECVRLYCSNCSDIYFPFKQCHKHIDGAYFGTTFANLFLLSFPTFKPRQILLQHQYTPKIFGFRLHKTWHSIALKEWNAKYNPNKLNINNETINNNIDDNKNELEQKNESTNVQKQINYLMQIKEKQNDEMLRLEHIIQKQQKEISKTKSLNKRQSIQLLSLQTKLNVLEQQSMPNLNKQINAPLPATIYNNDETKELDQEIGFKDIVGQINRQINTIQNKYNKSKTYGTNNKDLQIQLDEITNVLNSFKLYLNQTMNGI